MKSFRCRDTEMLHQGQRRKRFQACEKVARRKLRMLDAATNLVDLKSPGNQLEELQDDRAGQHSIRINLQWRLCFRWKDGDAYDAEIVDFH
jgi:toxin HigB-1